MLKFKVINMFPAGGEQQGGKTAKKKKNEKKNVKLNGSVISVLIVESRLTRDGGRVKVQ